jgi:energy-coupling factor transporter ATP-binding protein EcfA2
VKITKIEVCDFKGFPGPAVYDFEFGNARNLLVYGENGSGKSSLYRAIKEFFNRDKPPRPFTDFKNITNPTITDGSVSIEFDTGAKQQWQFGGDRPLNNPPTSQVALQVGCLDYRSLLETNFTHKGETVNLFDIAVSHLVDRMEIPIGGSTARIGELWKDVLASVPKRNYTSRVARCLYAIQSFNDGFEPVLTPLIQKASELLSKFPSYGLGLNVSYQRVDYKFSPKQITNQELILAVKKDGQIITNHHDFLNEAKLSAIGLVIYLAGLLISVPTQSGYPKLLVLDDVLIGLDMENRWPLLQILSEYFTDWQVVLMTHDKVWYEMVMLHLKDPKVWSGYELHLDNDAPVHQPRKCEAAYFLDRARNHLKNNDVSSAANYVRSAFEWKVKSYCNDHSLPVQYKRDPKQIKAEHFWQAAQTYAINKAVDPIRSDLKQIFAEIDLWKKFVMNQLSHSEAATTPRTEIQSAIDAVDRLRFK